MAPLPPGAALVDQRLSELAGDFDFLLCVTPVNLEQAWTEFRASGYRQEPGFVYRPLPDNLAGRRQALQDLPLDGVEDPVLCELLSEKRDELERRTELVALRGSPKFRLGALRHYGAVDEELRGLVEELRRHTEKCARTPANEKCLDAHDLAQCVRKELQRYREEYPGFPVTVEIRDDITAGMMVSRDRLLISRTVRFRESRVYALLQHEVGTHLVTYYNGACQPLKQLRFGLAGYEALQEGLATLAEFVAGGLEPKRMRKLAARVAAVVSMSGGASFAETFALMRDGWSFSTRESFHITIRVYRGGGLTKDAIYLKGLRNLLQHLAASPDLEPLLVGKVALGHLPLLNDLRQRGLIGPPRALPHYWTEFETRERLEHCASLTLPQLLGEVRS